MALSRITAASIEDGTVVAADIADGAVTGPKLGATSINANNIVTGAVTGDKLGLTSITGDKIGVGQITANLFASGAVSTTSISNGNSNVSIASANSDVSIFTAGTKAAEFDSSANFQFNSGYGSVATAYGCRAWVNFDGTTNVGGNCTIRASGNVSTVADNGTGNYTVNFTNALSDANYAAVCSSGTAGGYNMTAYVLTTSSVRLSSTYESAGPADTVIAQVAVFR
jgi:hypothetical protein